MNKRKMLHKREVICTEWEVFKQETEGEKERRERRQTGGRH